MSDIKYESLGDMLKDGKCHNALAELAEEMKEGLDCLVCVPHLVKVYGKAQRIIAELAKVESLYEKMNSNASKGNIAEAEELAHELHLAKGSMFANCRAIAEEGEKK